MDDKFTELRALLESGFQSMREEMTAFRDEIRGEIGEIKATLQVHLMRLAALQESIGSVQRQLTEQNRVLAVQDRVLDSLTRDIHQIRRAVSTLKGDIDAAHEHLPGLLKDVVSCRKECVAWRRAQNHGRPMRRTEWRFRPWSAHSRSCRRQEGANRHGPRREAAGTDSHRGGRRRLATGGTFVTRHDRCYSHA
jgi:cob(I)alamin adenosyltransferase